MSCQYLAVVAVLLLAADTGMGHAPKPGDPGSTSRPVHPLAACPAADPALTLQHRAALLYLRSEGARRVVQLVRRPPPSCPPASDVMDSLLQETGLSRLGGPLVMGRPSDWARLDRWRKEAGEEVAVLVQDGELLAEAISQSQAVWWREALWYAPEMDQGGQLEKVGSAHKFRIVTSTMVDGLKQDWTDTQAETSSLTAGKEFDMKSNDIDSFNTSREEQPISPSLPAAPSVVLLRWAPPLPLNQRPLLEVLRSSPWLLAGVYRPGCSTVESPAALLVQRSVLRSQLAAAGCATWRAELSGADPLTGAALSRSYTSDTLPVVVTLQGGGPLRVAVTCPELRATLRCRVDLERQTCRWDGQRSSRRRREAGQRYGREQSAGWTPTQWRGRGADRRYKQRAPAGGWPAAPVQQRTEEASQQPSDQSSQLQPPTQHQTEAPSPSWQGTQLNPYHTGVTTSGYSSTAYQRRSGAAYQPYSGETQPGHYSGATYPAEYSGDAHSQYSGDTYSQYSGDTYPAVYEGHAQRRQDSAERRKVKMLSEDIRLAVLPSFASCGGAVAGCMTCITLLTVLDVGISPFACIGPCSLGGGSACSGAVGTLYKEVRKAQIAMARKRRRQLGGRAQRRIGRFGARRSSRHL